VGNSISKISDMQGSLECSKQKQLDLLLARKKPTGNLLISIGKFSARACRESLGVCVCIKSAGDRANKKLRGFYIAASVCSLSGKLNALCTRT